MVDVVAKALCEAAGRPHNGEAPVCSHCERSPNGEIVCIYWETFREEARAAITAAYLWNKRERRWPSWVTKR